jgi:radical SAM protein with 4Fe4S-binding SPASM domain
MSDKVEFLTQKQIDSVKIISVLQQESTLSPFDKDILEKIITKFQKNDFSLLTPQEIQFLNHNPTNIWAQYLVFRYKFKEFPSNHIVSQFPIYLLIEPVSACNLRCVMCFQIDKTFSGVKDFMGYMNLDLFKKVVDEAYQKGTKAITLASRGEPTLHPKLGEMLEYCSGKFFELKINTNATKLPEKLIHQILTSGVTDVVFSIDSYTKENYESIRVGGIFENVLNNIKKFKEIQIKDYPNSKCATRVSGVKVDKSQNEKLFKEFWEKYVDHVVMVNMLHRWDTYHNPKEIMANEPCHALWERMYVWYDGKCNPCDADYKSELNLGNISNSTIEEVWNGEKYNLIREAHLNNNRSSYFPCDRCPNGA